jgi:hypothetical protein
MARLSLLIFLCYLNILPGFSQYFEHNVDIPVFISGDTLSNPWAGGLYNPQFSDIDLNNDGIKDIFIFDRASNSILTFINAGTPGQIEYTYSPHHESLFPKMWRWTLLVDYNCDGLEDIFTFERFSGGISVFRNDFNPTNGLSFSSKDSILWDQGSGLSILPGFYDVPALSDVDNDGDIDILLFNGSAKVDYYRNLSIENYGNCDSLIYVKENECWGNFIESAINNGVTLGISCKKGKQAEPNRWIMQNQGSEQTQKIEYPSAIKTGLNPRNETTQKSRHIGGSSILAADLDSDGDKDVILGDLGANRMVMLTNGGDSIFANMVEKDTSFPTNTLAVDLFSFPIAFQLDVDNDNLDDIIASTSLGGQNMDNCLLYKNVGTPDTSIFSYQTHSFLQGQMIDAGSGSAPVLFDFDGDNLKDLVIGNHGYLDIDSNEFIGALTSYKNAGTLETPQFEFSSRDFAGLAQYHFQNLHTTFGDLDDDGDEDLLIGDASGQIRYFENTGGPGNPALFSMLDSNFMDIDVGSFSTPQLVDVNHDELLDLLIGERSGNVNYFENTGTISSPNFELTTDFFGEVDVRVGFSNTGFSTPFLTSLHDSGPYFLLVGSESGQVFLFSNIDNNLTGAFNLITSQIEEMKVGEGSKIFCHEIDDDGKLECVVGNNRGGVAYFEALDTTISTFISENPVFPISFSIIPNPNDGYFNIEIKDGIIGKNWQMAIFDILGKQLYRESIVQFQSNPSFQFHQFPPGVYLCQLISPNGDSRGQKFVIE